MKPVFHQLTQHVLNEDNPPAQRIRALELLGRTHEVGLFVERREVVTINSSVDIKARLLDQLKTFIRADVEDVQDKGAESLLAEISRQKTPTGTLADQDDPRHTPPPELDGLAVSQDTHSIPLTQSTPEFTLNSSKKENNNLQVIDFIEEKVVTLNVYSEKEGGGGSLFSQRRRRDCYRNTPRRDSGSSEYTNLL